MATLQVLRAWPARRWAAAALASVVSLLALGIPTAMIPNPVFARPIDAPAWTYPSLAVTALLAGLLLASYVRAVDPEGSGAGPSEASIEETRSFTLGGMLSFFAIGCPTCNKLVLVALGSSGAITWFEPVQPVLAVLGIGVLVWALRRRLMGELTCRVSSAAV